MAAGIILVREAGGFVEALPKDGSMFETGTILAANTGTFEGFAKVVRGD
jgi:myo-inositol-1(or 4)-monophosphatase